MVIIVVDGYNIIGAWQELERLKKADIGQARDRLIELMADFQAYSGYRVIIVFDAYYVRGTESRNQKYNVEIIYTKENETADECIERLVKSLKNVKTQVYVATSDYTEQWTVFAQGALRLSARELYAELKNTQMKMTRMIEKHRKEKPQTKIPIRQDVLERFEKWRRGES
ncbi:MAG TPA: NYN domain-containing protein [Bacillota bacterium]|nr:NYN domain-containing protein [Bacillota bacterium]